MTDERIIMQVLTEQKDEKNAIDTSGWVQRYEEGQFDFDDGLAQVVIGVRRSGKSTLCHKVLKKNKLNYGYVNFDDDRLGRLEMEELNTVLSCLYQLYGADVPCLFFDEIQNIEGWHLFVNRLLRLKKKVFVTGSNAKLLSSELATHLTGRYNEIRLFPFSFAEYCLYHKIDTESITTQADAERKRALLEYLNTGGFPEMQSMRNRKNYIQSLLEAILQKDIQQRYNIKNIQALRLLAHHLINNTCQMMNYEELSSLLGMSDKTLKRYVDFLRQAFLIQLLPRHSYKSRERVVGEKSYIVDTGIVNNHDYSLAGENIGWRLENVVYIELLRRCSREFYDVYYYRPTTHSKEVDFAVCNQGRVREFIQVAYDISAPKTLERELSALVAASSAVDCSTLTLIAYTETREVTVKEKKIKIYSIIDWLLESDGRLLQKTA